MDATNIQQAKNNRFSAMRCTEKAMIFEDIHDVIEVLFMKAYIDGENFDLNKLKEVADYYKERANSEWLATRNYEKGEG